MWRLSARWAYRTLLYSVAITLVLFAVLLTVLRYLLPQLPDLTEQAEAFVQQQYSVTADIGRLSADWRTSGPQIVLHDLQMQPTEQQATRVELPEARVHLNFWGSLRTWSLQFEQITLSDARFTYDLREVKADGLPQNDLIPQLLLNQLDLVVIENSRVQLINLVGVERVIDIARLSWMNDGASHQGIGQLRIADFTENTLDIIIDIEGNDPQSLAGQVYVNAENLDITPWLQQQVVDTEVETAEFNFTLWLNFDDSTFNDGSLQLGRNALRWNVDNRDHQLTIPAGLLKLNPIPDGWLVNSNPITVQHNDTAWQLPPFSWQRNAQGQAVSIQAAPVAELARLLTITGSAGARLSDDLTGRSLQGNADVVAVFPTDGAPRWWLQSSDLEWQEAAGIPGLEGIQAELWGEGLGAATEVSWQVQGTAAQIRSATLSPEREWSLNALAVQGDLKFAPPESDRPAWQLFIDRSSRLELPGLPLRFGGHLQPHNDSVAIALTVQSDNAANFSVAGLRDNLPLAVGAQLQDYLSTSIVSAEVIDLAIVWRGTLRDFPYTDGTGVFQARTRLADFTYAFRPEWLPLTDSRSVIDFRNERMHIVSTGSRLGNMQLPIINTRIPQLNSQSPELLIAAEISGAAQELQPIFAASPLASSLGSTFTQLKLAGPLNGLLNLTIPLKSGGEVIAEGYANLADNDLFVESIQQQFRDLNGVIRFNNAAIESEDLLFTWQGQSVDAELVGQPEADDYRVDLALTGAWQDFDTELATGVFDWRGRLQLVLQPESYSFNWQQRSDLADLALALPEPLTKARGTAVPWQLQVSGGNDSILINSQYGDQALLELQLDNEATLLQQGFLRIGDEVPSEPNPNTMRLNPKFMVQIGHADIQLESWLTTLSALAEHGAQTDPAGRERWQFLRPDYIEMITPSFQFGDHQLTDFEGVLWPTDSGWLFRAQADQAQLDGSLNTVDDVPLAVTINADYLELEPPAAALAEAVDTEVETIAEIDLSAVPRIDFNCQRCRYGDYPLGEVAFSVAPDAAGLRVNSLRIANNGHVFTAAGLWQQGESLDTLTRMEGNFRSNDLGAFLSDYNITTMVQDSPAEMTFELSWQGPPDGYNTETLNGRLDWQLGQGYLNEVSDGGARIFSLLSLEGILRKLRFDFRDVFANGLFYTSFGGGFGIENGVVRTNNTVLNGSAGDMEVTGQANLITREIDYQLFYVPKVTSSLPVILAWMVNPPSGLAALLIDRMLHNAQVISRLEYKISGTMDEPIVEEVARSSREVPIPQEPEPQATETNDDDSNTDNPAAGNRGANDQSAGT